MGWAIPQHRPGSGGTCPRRTRPSHSRRLSRHWRAPAPSCRSSRRRRGAWDRTERTEEEVSQKKGAGTGGLVGWLGSARACDGLVIDRGQSEEGLGPATCIQRYSSHRAERRTVHGVRSDNRGGRSITLQMALPSRLNSKSYTYTYTYTYTS